MSKVEVEFEFLTATSTPCGMVCMLLLHHELPWSDEEDRLVDQDSGREQGAAASAVTHIHVC